MIPTLLAYFVATAVVPLPRPDPRKDWPTAHEMEVSLGAKPGAEFPKMLKTKTKGLFHVYYVGTTPLADGRFAVEVRLKRHESNP